MSLNKLNKCMSNEFVQLCCNLLRTSYDKSKQTDAEVRCDRAMNSEMHNCIATVAGASASLCGVFVFLTYLDANKR